MNTDLKENLQALRRYAESLTKMASASVATGLPREKIGSDVYRNGMTVAKIGGIHEYGASIDHPGGTPYVRKEGGGATFVKKGQLADGVTKAHTITIPARSFLRVPFDIHADAINRYIAQQFESVLKGSSVEQVLGRIGVYTLNISVGAFTTNGYGTWPPLAASTKRQKGSSAPLIDTGLLRGSLTYAVRNGA